MLATERPGPNSAIMTHPRDTIAQLEFMNPTGTAMGELDPRLQPGCDPSWWADNHPLGLVNLAYATVLTRDRGRAKHIFTDILGGTLVHEGRSELAGTDSSYVQVGDTVVELATPTTDGSLAAADMAANGEIFHAATFRVRDLGQAEKYLQSKGIEPLASDETTLLTRPETTTGAVPVDDGRAGQRAGPAAEVRRVRCDPGPQPTSSTKPFNHCAFTTQGES